MRALGANSLVDKVNLLETQGAGIFQPTATTFLRTYSFRMPTSPGVWISLHEGINLELFLNVKAGKHKVEYFPSISLKLS